MTCDNIYLRANGDYGWITSGEKIATEILLPSIEKIEGMMNALVMAPITDPTEILTYPFKRKRPDR